jgi:hypothetical protein
LENYSDNPQYNEIKNAAADMLIDRVEKVIPNLRKHIKYMEVGTPITNWRYSRNTGGAIYGSEQSVDNMYFNRLQAKTPVQNLFLTGAWTFAGGMSAAMMSGRETSRIVLGYLDGHPAVLMTSPQVMLDEQAELSSNQAPAKSVTPQKTDVPLTNYQLPVIKTIGSNLEIDLNAIGKPAVLLFHTQETAEQAAVVNSSLRAQDEYKNCDSLFIANIVDLHSVPKLFRGFAEKAMKESYEKAAASLPPNVDPASMVLILPDWDGSVTKTFGLKDTNRTAAIAVLDPVGNLVGVYQGESAEVNALALLKKV